MKNKKMTLLTVTLIVVSALLLTGSVALLALASGKEETLPEASAVPDVPELAGLPDEGQRPVSVLQSQSKEEDGKRVTSVLTEEEMNLLAERRANGEWMTLSMEEMTAVVKDTVALFYASDRIDVGTVTDGVYSVTSYNGYLYYTSDAYEKQPRKTAPDAAGDVYDIIFARICAYNDSVYGTKTDYSDYSCAFADLSRPTEQQLELACIDTGHFWTSDGNRVSADFLMFDRQYKKSITAYTHDPEKCHTPYAWGSCCEIVELRTDEFEKDFGEPEFVEGSRRVRVEIFEEATQTLITEFTVTDQAEVNAIFENFLASFQKACDEFEAHVASDEDKAYRSAYRIVAHMESTYENVIRSEVHDMDICYPYGYSNDVYGYLHNDIWMDYLIQGGKDFIDLIDVYVDQHIPA